MSSCCQVIKSNDRRCRNYARKGLTCCWSHRKLENDIPDKVVPEPIEWPSLEEANAEIKHYSINTLENIVVYAREKIVLDLPKYELRLVALTISESVMKLQIPEHGKASVRNLVITIIKKLLESGYSKQYIERLGQFYSSI